LWASHDLTLKNISGTAKRTNRFKPDNDVDNPVQPTDYAGSGYDRGHLVPAADMKLDAYAMSESFLMSNISPQVAEMNRGLWNSLELAMRKWVRQFGDAWVITAPVLSGTLTKLPSGVSIPKYFYKIIYIPEQEMMAAFLVPNVDTSGQKFWSYVTSVDEIEQNTGIDFFHELEDRLENKLENQVANRANWPIN